MKNLVEIKEKLFIPFDWIDPTPGGRRLGRAEFAVCLKFLRGRISEFWVDPVQTHIDALWHYSGGNVDFTIQAYEKLESEGIWLVSYCKFHKATFFRLYAPRNAKFLLIDHNGISFYKTNIYLDLPETGII
jgi:hypothetical protein